MVPATGCPWQKEKKPETLSFLTGEGGKGKGRGWREGFTQISLHHNYLELANKETNAIILHIPLTHFWNPGAYFSLKFMRRYQSYTN